jgi:hypothetical protein
MSFGTALGEAEHQCLLAALLEQVNEKIFGGLLV